MQKSDFNKVALHRLLLKPGPWTQTQKNTDPEKPDSWKTWEAVGCKKKKRLEDHVQFIITLKFWKKTLVSEASGKIVNF